jgi:hypothetical protein
MFRPADKIYFSTAVAVFLLYYSVLLLLPGFTLLREADTFWQIRTGQWILDHAEVPVADFYSYTAFGKRWISGQWLAEILFALAFNLGQWRGVVLLTAASCSAVIALVCIYLERNLRFSVAIGWMAITALIMVPHFVARPHVFSYILLLLWIITLLDRYDSGDWNISALTPFLCFLMILWVNVHGSFTIGLAFLYIFVGFSCHERFVHRDYKQCTKILFMVFVVSVCALVTPYGAESTLLVLQVMNMSFLQANIVEWMSPNFQVYSLYLCYLVAILAAMAGLGIQLRGPRLVIFSMMMFFGLSHTRGLLMFFLLAPIILSRPILERAAWLQESSKASDPVLRFLQDRPFAMPAIFLVLAVVVTGYSWHKINVGPPKSVSPNAAIDFVKTRGITGNVFNSYAFGGYLIFVGIPTFIDGRTPPHSDDFVRRYFNAVNLKDIDDAFRLLDEYEVRWVLLSPEEPLGKALARSASWDEVYSDDYSIVLARRR